MRGKRAKIERILQQYDMRDERRLKRRYKRDENGTVWCVGPRRNYKMFKGFIKKRRERERI